MIAKTNSFIILGETLPKESSAPRILDEFPLDRPHQSTRELVRIRTYDQTDRDAICRLCCETGFLGRPMDTMFQDRELFADLFTKAYLDHEPDWAMVAEANGKVVGYLLGSVRRNFDFLQMASGFQTASRMVMRLLTGRYAQHPRSRRFIRWLFTAGFFEQPKHPRNAAHLHLDIERKYRGRGVGRHLWDLYERRLRSAGIRECYGAFFSYPRRRPESAYAYYGFSIFDRRRTTLFGPEISEPVEVVCVRKAL